jgi:hypothetical protein
MPPRTITLGIVALWLAALGWMAYREWWREPEPPPLLDRTDEVGKQTARWKVRVKGDVIGHAQTALSRPRRDRLFALSAGLTFDKDFRFRGKTITKLKSIYRATARGQLRKLECEVDIGEHEARAWGEFDDTGFRITVNRKSSRGSDSEQARADGQFGGLNLLHPFHRLAGLYEGRRWEVRAIDPLTMARQRRLDDPDPGIFALRAETVPAEVFWDEQTVPCWRVDFRKGGSVAAQVWARPDDGLVLRQQVWCGGMSFDLEREAEHTAGKLPGLRLPGLGQ